jgi:hypothetical protein
MAPVKSSPVFIPYHQFLTRPVKNRIPTSFTTVSQTPHARHIREMLSIQHPGVHDLDFVGLWRIVSEALDVPHDLANCKCCSGKASVASYERCFVLAICGDLRGGSPCKLSWPLYSCPVTYI